MISRLRRLTLSAVAATAVLGISGVGTTWAESPADAGNLKQSRPSGKQLAQVCPPWRRPVCGWRFGRWTNYRNLCVAQRAGATNIRNGACVAGNTVTICRNYANRAVAAHRQNVARRCGYTGTRWQYSFANHYNWCVRVSQSARNSETNARNVALQRCGSTGGGSKVSFCRNYAQRAVNHQRINQARRCGGWGARWHANYGNHYNWCMGTHPNRARAEDRARQARLQRCGAGGGGAACNDTRPVCGQWRGRRYNFANICQLRRRGAQFIRYGRCGGGGGGGGAGSCWVQNARITVSSGGCTGQSVRLRFPFSRMQNGQRWRLAINSGTIGQGYSPYGVCNFHTNITYQCVNGRLRIQRVHLCRQARNPSAACRVSQ